MPRNIDVAINAINASVRLASTGALNAGTPSETASTPVIAVQPFENAVSNTNTVIAPVPSVGRGSTGSTGTTCPVIICERPVTISTNITPTNPYTGTPNNFVDSLRPRRLPSIRTAMKISARMTRFTCIAGTAEVIADTPAAMLTAT